MEDSSLVDASFCIALGRRSFGKIYRKVGIGPPVLPLPVTLRLSLSSSFSPWDLFCFRAGPFLFPGFFSAPVPVPPIFLVFPAPVQAVVRGLGSNYPHSSCDAGGKWVEC